MAYDYKKDIDPTLAEMKKGYEEIGNKEKESINQKKDKNIAYAEKETAEKIDETTDDYVDILRSAGIQKELDLRDIQETRANMGLSRSGLSATEQTAAILSAGNKTAVAQRNRQKAIDSLNQSLANYRIQQETEANDSILAIDKGIEENLAKARVDLTNKANELTSADIKAEIEAETKRKESDDKVKIAQINARKKEETDRVNALYKAKENNQISEETLSHAIVNGLSVKQAIQYQNTSSKFETLVTEGKISGEEKDEYIKKNFTPEYAELYSTVRSKALRIKNQGVGMNDSKKEYLIDALLYSGLELAEINDIAKECGLTESDFEKHKK